LDRIKDHQLVILLLTNKETNLRHATTIHLDKMLVRSDIDMKNQSTRQEAKAETATISKNNNTPIRSQTLLLLFPAKTQELFYPIRKRINKVFNKCRLSQCTSSTFLKPSNKNMCPILTSAKSISTPNL
jgi:hypothetical protein